MKRQAFSFTIGLIFGAVVAHVATLVIARLRASRRRRSVPLASYRRAIARELGSVGVVTDYEPTTGTITWSVRQ